MGFDVVSLICRMKSVLITAMFNIQGQVVQFLLFHRKEPGSRELLVSKLLVYWAPTRMLNVACVIYNILEKLNVASKTVLMNTDDLYSTLLVITSILQFVICPNKPDEDWYWLVEISRQNPIYPRGKLGRLYCVMYKAKFQKSAVIIIYKALISWMTIFFSYILLATQTGLTFFQFTIKGRTPTQRRLPLMLQVQRSHFSPCFQFFSVVLAIMITLSAGTFRNNLPNLSYG